jgi:Zn-dependent M28 family amino/carboxypeptidase
MLGPTIPGFKQPTSQAEFNTLVNSHGYLEYQKMVQAAAGTMGVGSAASFAPARLATIFHPTGWNATRVPLKGDKPTPMAITVSAGLAETILGSAPASATKGATGKTVAVNIKFKDTPVPGRNVVAILEGDMKNEYIIIGAHNDHVPPAARAVEHDSLRALNSIARPGGAESQYKAPTPEQWVRINAMKDSLRALHGGARMDSINNGADDDGSGSMAVLEIAEAFAKASSKPKRSIIFIWHVGEELGMYGSQYFTDYPTVPREQIVAALNVDMIGRGDAKDAPGLGGPQYLQLLGSRRLSTEYGDLVEKVIKDTNSGFVVDYQYDANDHPQQFYCRSDHWSYARYGIPVTFFSTGGHQDYHMLTDEPQYIDYRHYTRVTQLIHDVADRVANLDHKLVVDGEKGDPYRACKQ